VQEAFLGRLALPAKMEKTAHPVNADLKAIEETEAMRELEDLLDNPYVFLLCKNHEWNFFYHVR